MSASLVSVTSHGLFGAGSDTCDYPAESDVRDGVVYDFGAMVGTFTGDYPFEADVRDGVDYDFGTKTGNLVVPAEGDVLEGVGYGSLGDEFFGTLECLTPPTPVPPVDGMSPFAAIAQATRIRLSLVLGLHTAYVVPVANDRYKVTVDEPFFVYLQWFTPSQPRDPALRYTDSGAGRRNRTIGRRLRVYVYTRSGEDAYGGDAVALFGTDPAAVYGDTPTTRGHFLQEERVYNALDDWMPLSGDDEPLCLTPLHDLDASEFPERAPEDEAGLLRSCLDFEVVYILSQDPTEPPS